MTNEEYIRAIDMRRSRRSYTSHALDAETLSVIQSMIDAVNTGAGLDFMLVEDATSMSRLFTGKYSAIAVCGDDSERSRVLAGYYGESIVLQCVYHGLGTCWCTGTYDENKAYELLDIPRDVRLYGIIVIGNAKSGITAKERLMYNATHKKNKPYQKMLGACDRKLPPYYAYAMQLVEKAPSAVNRRPVVFRYEEGQFSGSVDAPYSDKSIDFGIAQLHFQLGAAAKGVKGEWDSAGRFCPEDAKVIKFPNESENED